MTLRIVQHWKTRWRILQNNSMRTKYDIPQIFSAKCKSIYNCCENLIDSIEAFCIVSKWFFRQSNKINDPTNLKQYKRLCRLVNVEVLSKKVDVKCCLAYLRIGVIKQLQKVICYFECFIDILSHQFLEFRFKYSPFD